jgi:hypothetical protein
VVILKLRWAQVAERGVKNSPPSPVVFYINIQGATARLLKLVGIGGRRDIFEIREDEREAIAMTSDDQVFEKNGGVARHRRHGGVRKADEVA